MLPFVSRLCRIACRISRRIPCEMKTVRRNFAARTSSNKGLQRVNYTGASHELRFVDIRGRFNPPLSASLETLRGLLLRLPADSGISSYDMHLAIRKRSLPVARPKYNYRRNTLYFRTTLLGVPGFLTGVWSRLVFVLQLRVHRNYCSTVCRIDNKLKTDILQTIDALISARCTFQSAIFICYSFIPFAGECSSLAAAYPFA